MDDFKRVKTAIRRILNICVDGPDILTDYEIRRAVEAEALKCLDRLNKGEKNGISVRQS